MSVEKDLITACQMTSDPYERLKVLANIGLQAPPDQLPDLVEQIMRAVRQIQKPKVQAERYEFYQTAQPEAERQQKEDLMARQRFLALQALAHGDDLPNDLKVELAVVSGLKHLLQFSSYLTVQQKEEILRKAETLAL